MPVTHLVHHLVATVDAGRAADAFVLQPVANIDSGWTHLHADSAIDAGAQPRRRVICRLAARTARIPALTVISNNQGIGVEHDALKTRIWAHVFAHLLTHPAGIAVGRESIEQYPE